MILEIPGYPEVQISVEAEDGNGRIESNLFEQMETTNLAGLDPEDYEEPEYIAACAMLHVVESMILAHACAGIDVSSKAYCQGLTTVLSTIENY